MLSPYESAFLSTDAVDPTVVPYRIELGAKIPAIGLGTFGADHVAHSAVADAVKYAASIGYRHFDCASVYGNEDQIGKAIRFLPLSWGSQK